MGTKKVRNLRPRILRGVVGTTEYEVLVGGAGTVDEKLANFWEKQGDVEVLGHKQAEQPSTPEQPDQDNGFSEETQGALPGTEGQKRHSGFHGK